jgi:outer membrane protein insertion porin family
MQKKIIQIALITIFLYPIIASSNIINYIEISGTQATSRATVLNYLPVEVGDNYDENTSYQIIENLYKTGFFKDIEVSQEQNTLKIKVKENPHIKSFELLNYSNKVVINKKTIDQTLKSIGLSKGKIFNKKELDKLVKQIKLSYIDKGYYDIDIVETIEIDEQQRVDIKLVINEGKVARIGEIKIIGNKFYKEKKILAEFKIGKADFFIVNFFTKKDHFSQELLDVGIEKMKLLYRDAGYLDFKVNKVDVKTPNDKNKINIFIDITEGVQYKISSVNLSGELLDVSVDDIKKLITFSDGDIFDRKEIIKSIDAITYLFADKGYAFARVNPITRKNDNDTTDIKLDIILNEKTYVNRITISGNTRTLDEVIRREISIYEGSIYSKTEIKDSIIRIRRLGFFSDIKINQSRAEGFNNRVDLHFDVTETKTGKFSIGLSHSNLSGIGFKAQIRERNFLGTGNTLVLFVSNSEALQLLDLKFINPYFTKDRHSISYGIFSKRVDGAKLELDQYKINEAGFNFGYEVPIKKETTKIGAEIIALKRSIVCGDTFAKENEINQCANDDNSEVKLILKWTKNTLNDFNFPTDGIKAKISYGISLPITDFRYSKIDFFREQYIPINEKITWKLKSQIGIAKGYDGKEVPFFERYNGGGPSSVRGFKFNTLGPLYSNDKPKGGEFSLILSTSIISPIDAINNSDNMRISAFIDAGMISDSFSNFNSNKFKVSVGAAFIWLTPIGPLGFYVARPLVSESGDQTISSEFTIGANF